MIIDDDPQTGRTYARLLARDFDVDVLGDAREAQRRLAAGERVDVILCDRGLGPGLSGQDFFDCLSLELQQRVVIFSGTEPAPDDAFAASLGDRYHFKLASIASLIAVLLRAANAKR